MIAKIVLVLGILGVILGFLVAVGSAILPEMTSGRVSWEEAMLGIIPGIVVLSFSFIVAVVGLIFVIVGRKKP